MKFRMRQITHQGWMPRSKKTAKYKAMILKSADVLRGPPFFKEEAAHALTNWVQETNKPEPALDVSYCKLLIGLVALPSVSALEAGPDAQSEGEACQAVGLEPAMGKVNIKHVRTRVGVSDANHDQLVPTKKAQFVYSMAASLAREHGMSFDHAVVKAEKCWQRCPQALRNNLPQDWAPLPDIDNGQEVLDVEVEVGPRGE